LLAIAGTNLLAGLGNKRFCPRGIEELAAMPALNRRRQYRLSTKWAYLRL
jgi:hypothetical protein